MNRVTEASKNKITATEVANYAVCAEAWRLKRIKGFDSGQLPTPRMIEARTQREEWTAKQDLVALLRLNARVAYVLLFILAFTVFLWEHKLHGVLSGGGAAQDSQQHSVQNSKSTGEVFPDSMHLSFSLGDKFTVPNEIAGLMLMLGLIIFMWDLFERRSVSLQKNTGLNERSEALALRGGNHTNGRVLYSEKLGLESNPQAIVKEDGHEIPVDVYPLGKKVRDRHVIPLIVHLKLMEEIDKIQPPYGLLILGKEQRRVKIQNNPEKQRWVESLLAEMRSILGGVPAVPTPTYYKCKNCDVRENCKFSAYTPKNGENSAEEEQEQ